MYEQAEQEELAKEEEERSRLALLARFAQEDCIDQLNQQKRRLKLEEHQREVARLIAEKKSLEQAAKVGTKHSSEIKPFMFLRSGYVH